MQNKTTKYFKKTILNYSHKLEKYLSKDIIKNNNNSDKAFQLELKIRRIKKKKMRAKIVKSLVSMFRIKKSKSFRRKKKN